MNTDQLATLFRYLLSGFFPYRTNKESLAYLASLAGLIVRESHLNEDGVREVFGEIKQQYSLTSSAAAATQDAAADERKWKVFVHFVQNQTLDTLLPTSADDKKNNTTNTSTDTANHTATNNTVTTNTTTSNNINSGEDQKEAINLCSKLVNPTNGNAVSNNVVIDECKVDNVTAIVQQHFRSKDMTAFHRCTNYWFTRFPWELCDPRLPLEYYSRHKAFRLVYANNATLQKWYSYFLAEAQARQVNLYAVKSKIDPDAIVLWMDDFAFSCRLLPTKMANLMSPGIVANCTVDGQQVRYSSTVLASSFNRLLSDFCQYPRSENTVEENVKLIKRTWNYSIFHDETSMHVNTSFELLLSHD
jgi:hypothetical protein